MQPIQRPYGHNVNAPTSSASAAQMIGRSVAELMRGVHASFIQDMSRTFHETRAIAHIIGADNQVMLSALQTVDQTMRRAGIGLSHHQPVPEGVETLVRDTQALALMAYNDAHRGAPITFEPLDLQLSAIEAAQRTIDGFNSPLANVRPEHRWRFCLDPKKIDAIERHVSNAVHNKLLQFTFEGEAGYLSGLLKGWDVSMRNLNAPLNARLLTALHQTCCGHYGVDTTKRFPGGFGLTLGDNMTRAGRVELLAFVRQLRETFPGYAVVESREAFVSFQRRVEKAAPGEQIPPPPEPTGDNAVLMHAALSHRRLLLQADVFLEQHQVAMSRAENSEQRLELIVDVCQKLERLHPFPDGNCRVICNVLLNHLLVRNGMPLTLLNDPNVLDGWSRQEVIQEVKAGWARAAQYS